MIRPLHLLCLPTKVDQRESSEPGWATCDERSIGLMTFQESSLPQMVNQVQAFEIAGQGHTVMIL